MPSQVLGFGKEFTGYKDRAKPGEILRPIEDPVNYEPNAKTDYSKIGEPTKEIDLSSYFEVRASSGGRASQLEPHCGALMLAGWASVAPFASCEEDAGAAAQPSAGTAAEPVRQRGEGGAGARDALVQRARPVGVQGTPSPRPRMATPSLAPMSAVPSSPAPSLGVSTTRRRPSRSPSSTRPSWTRRASRHRRSASLRRQGSTCPRRTNRRPTRPTPPPSRRLPSTCPSSKRRVCPRSSGAPTTEKAEGSALRLTRAAPVRRDSVQGAVLRHLGAQGEGFLVQDAAHARHFFLQGARHGGVSPHPPRRLLLPTKTPRPLRRFSRVQPAFKMPDTSGFKARRLPAPRPPCPLPTTPHAKYPPHTSPSSPALPPPRRPSVGSSCPTPRPSRRKPRRSRCLRSRCPTCPRCPRSRSPRRRRRRRHRRRRRRPRTRRRQLRCTSPPRPRASIGSARTCRPADPQTAALDAAPAVAILSVCGVGAGAAQAGEHC